MEKDSVKVLITYIIEALEKLKTDEELDEKNLQNLIDQGELILEKSYYQQSDSFLKDVDCQAKKLYPMLLKMDKLEYRDEVRTFLKALISEVMNWC